MDLLCRVNPWCLFCFSPTKLLLGHASVQTTMNYLGTKQNLAEAVNASLGLTEGVLTWTVDGTPIQVGPGQALCIPQGAVHRFDNLGDEDAKQLAIGFKRRRFLSRTSGRTRRAQTCKPGASATSARSRPRVFAGRPTVPRRGRQPSGFPAPQHLQQPPSRARTASK